MDDNLAHSFVADLEISGRFWLRFFYSEHIEIAFDNKLFALFGI